MRPKVIIQEVVQIAIIGVRVRHMMLSKAIKHMLKVKHIE